jgi:stage V sporulation protein R
MTPSDLRRLIKAEERIAELARDKYGLEVMDIEFDVVPAQKMLEIMAYRTPTNISSWKYGRDYERMRTIHENIEAGLPYEVIINSTPPRAYLMNTNPFAVQVLVMAHVYGHVNMFTESRWFQAGRRDIMHYMAEANKRFNKYERRYGIDIVEKTVDAGHALQFHSSPFDNETENEKRERIFEQTKAKIRPIETEYGDITGVSDTETAEVDIALRNQNIWRKLMLKTPVEPTEDLLRYIIDNSRILEDWQKDVLEVLREEGRYFWPMIRTKYMNEGWATYWHEKICWDLFVEGILNQKEHGQYNFSNALVKAMHKGQMNPYLIGSEIWKDIEERWDKGRHGMAYENCDDRKTKEEWDTGALQGKDKMFSVMRSYTDWFFMQEFLTPELIDKINLYIFKFEETMTTIDVVRTRHTAQQIRDLIINSFAHSIVPKIEVVNGNFQKKGGIVLKHAHTGVDLDMKYATETMKHIHFLWGNNVHLKTKVGDQDVRVNVKQDGRVEAPKQPRMPPDPDIWQTLTPSMMEF